MVSSKLQLLFALCVLLGAVGAVSAFTQCARSWTKVGCYKDLVNNSRALPDQLVNIRDPYSKVFGERLLDWTRLSESFHSLACQCAEKTYERGYKVFGLQFYGECWSGKDGEETYDQFKTANAQSCVMGLNYHDNPVTWQYCDMESDKDCVGVASTNFVYTLEEPNSPVDGEWSDWNPWTPCDKTCGTGEQLRERTCTSPAPANGGADCPGSSEEVKECNLPECPINGGFTPWQPEECSVTCGGGEQRLVRSCTNPRPQFGGNDCMGPTSKTEPCNDFQCPIPCTRAIDIGVILDATQSVGQANFLISKNFVLALANSMNISPSGSHMGLIVYHVNPSLKVGFNELDKQDPNVIKEVLNGLTYLGPRTYTDRAIRLAAEHLFTVAGGDRPDKPDILVVLTDGRTNINSKPYEIVQQPLKDNGVKVIAVGVGNNIYQDELKKIAMGNEKNVIQVSNFDALFDKLQLIINSSCQD